MGEVSHDRRFLALAGADNARDLGGLPAADGRWTRTGRLVRAELTHALTDADIDLLSLELNLRTLIDLRGDDEVAAAPLLWPGENIRRLHCPLPFRSGQTRSGGRHDFISTYLGYLELDHVPLVRAIRALLDPDNHAVLYHCAAGKDRTGVLSAIVLEILGVPREAIAADYALSATRIHRVVARLAPIEIYSPDPNAAAAGVLAAEPGTILTFLDELDARHGGAERWLLTHGVQPREIERFRRAMLTTDQSHFVS
jgi:protein-tyrosine phosphatase